MYISNFLSQNSPHCPLIYLSYINYEYILKSNDNRQATTVKLLFKYVHT